MWIKFDEIKLISTAVKTVVFHQRRCGPYHALIDDPNRSSCKARKVDYSSKKIKLIRHRYIDISGFEF